MSKKYNTRLIKTRESYSTKKIAQELGVHKRTVQQWYKEGLKLVDNQKPFLVMGYELKQFLEAKLKNRKCKLQEHEFYCTKCQRAVETVHNKVTLKISDHTIGNQGFQSLIIQGMCINCHSRINRFSHTGKLENIQQTFTVIEQGV